ncbi:MAG: hypothetical protein U9Q15_01350 [Patescibacteria group bacterium]|nr:hypothetical protein [Patescibacteria group bacterium]
MLTIDQALDHQFNHSLEAKILSFEDRFAILEIQTPYDTPKANTLYWPIKNLSEDINIGDTLRLDMSTQASRKKEQEDIARKVFEQMIN